MVIGMKPNSAIKDSTLCGMSLNDFYKAMVSVVFPGYTVFYAEDKVDNYIEYPLDDIAARLYTIRVSDKLTYYIGNGLSDAIPIPEFIENDQRLIDATMGIAGESFRTFNNQYIKAECLAKCIRMVDEFTRFAAHHIYRPYAVIDGFAPWLKYKSETFSYLAVTIIKWLTARLPIEDRNVFVDYLADEECYYELYVELVQFIHEYLTEQDNTAKFEL
jgi:hypothetical protein